jgi:hypothetical protein
VNHPKIVEGICFLGYAGEIQRGFDLFHLRKKFEDMISGKSIA